MDEIVDKKTYSFRCSDDIPEDKLINKALSSQKNKSVFIKNCIIYFIKNEEIYLSINDIKSNLNQLLKNQETILDNVSTIRIPSEKISEINTQDTPKVEEINTQDISKAETNIEKTSTEQKKRDVNIDTATLQGKSLPPFNQKQLEEKQLTVDNKLAANIANCMSNFIKM